MIIDKRSSEWLNIKDYFEERLADFREQNDSDLSAAETERLRGKIEFVKEMLDLGEEDPDIKVGDNSYLPD